ncbi:uncharacterized protein [Ptychodera flava]|uniref:uncharacterized protein n=1 Tax=Ptychodera flava TaxID=63121 RepID=UPI003969D0AC
MQSAEHTSNRRSKNRHYRSEKRKTNRKNKRRREIKPDTNTVTNLSSNELTDAQLSLLAKGLTFCPTPNNINMNELNSDIYAFKRRCRLAYEFNSKEKKKEQQKIGETPAKEGPFPKKKSEYQPAPGQSQTLELFLSAVEKDILNESNWKRTWPNLTMPEQRALNDLKSNTNIVIKPADKGGGVVVMDKSEYIRKCEEQLNNDTYYTQLESDPTEKYMTELERAIQRWKRKKWISHSIAKELIPKEPKPGHFYGLPKIHKDGIPLRPIIPQCQALTSQLSRYVDYHLQPIVKSLPSYIKDTNHHLEDLQNNEISPNTIMVSMDVVSLYSNIPNEFGIQAVKKHMIDRNITNPPPELISEMLTFILNRNYFEFNGSSFYKQWVQQWGQ